MVKIIEKIQQVTSKGQITLPAVWRKQFHTSQVIVSAKGDKIEISPAHITKEKEYTVFDAIRDNQGKGIKAKDLVALIKKIDK
ncbi:MAG: AbrB/MazE/SpoVT family DNA-binding domain-containing protein [Minisyncoccota bacterium]